MAPAAPEPAPPGRREFEFFFFERGRGELSFPVSVSVFRCSSFSPTLSSYLTSERGRVAVLARDRLARRLAVVHRARELGPDDRRLGDDALDGDELAEQRRGEVARGHAGGAEVAREAEAEAGARVD